MSREVERESVTITIKKSIQKEHLILTNSKKAT